MQKLIRDIPKHKGELVRVELSEFKGCDTVQVRIWYETGQGLWRPTPKGIQISVRRLPELRQAIEEAERIARESGIISTSAPV